MPENPCLVAPRARRHPRLSLIAVCACLGLAALPGAALAQPAPPAPVAAPLNLPAQSLATALDELARRSGASLAYTPAQVQGLRAGAVQAAPDVASALAQMLRGTGLAARQRGATWTLHTAPTSTDAPAAATLPAVTVTATAARESATGPAHGYLATHSRSADKDGAALIDTPRAVSVVTAEQMGDRSVQSVEAAVAYSAGVQASAFGNDPRFDQINVRGFAVADGADYRDGLRQPNSGWLSYYRSEPYGLERVEVLKGPASLEYGQVAPGGLVNRVSKRPSAAPRREVQLQWGTQRHRQGQFDVGGAASERVNWRLTGLARKSGTDTVGVNDDSLYIAPALTWRPGADTEVTLLGHAQRYETGGSARLFQYPSGVLSRVWPGDIDFDHLRQTQYALGYEVRHRFSERLGLRQNLRWGRVNTENQYLDELGLEADGDTLRRRATGVYEHMRTLAVDTALQGRFATGAVDHQLDLGIDHARLAGEVRYQQGPAPSLRLSQPDYHQPIAAPTQMLTHDVLGGRQSGLYLRDRLSWGPWRLVLGLRHDRVRQDTVSQLAGGSDQHERRSATTGSAGLLWRASSEISPYLSYATSFVPQFGRNQQGQPYAPTRGRQVEAGVKYQPSQMRALLTASVFELVQQNVLTTDPADAANRLQTGEVRTRGLELEATVGAWRGWDLVGSYTWQDMRTTRSNAGDAGKLRTGVARHMAALWVKHTLPPGPLRGLDVGLGARWVGASFANRQNTARNAGYGLFDLRVGYTVPGTSATVALNVSNLADKRYEMCHDGYCYRGRGRQALLSLNYQW